MDDQALSRLEKPMRALIADDDRTTTAILGRTLERLQLDVVVTHDGAQAWDILNASDPPALAILDWMMPALDGIEICRRLRADESRPTPYLILLTARDKRADMVAGFEAGADDFLVKPFDADELRARVRVGLRIVGLQARLADRVAELQEALTSVKHLSGLLPICSYCKRIRSDQDYWEQVDQYVAEHSEARFSHGICPTCYTAVTAELEHTP
jgi:sigma-B regulation protein RsbU (phosphoserine phosphatase)